VSETHQETIAALRLPGPASDSFQEFVADALDSLLADRARMEKALRAAAVYLDALGDNLLRNDADMQLDECRDPKDVAEGIRQALGASQ